MADQQHNIIRISELESYTGNFTGDEMLPVSIVNSDNNHTLTRKTTTSDITAYAYSYISTALNLKSAAHKAYTDKFSTILDSTDNMLPTVSAVKSYVDSKITDVNNKIGNANGIAPLNNDGKIDSTYLPASSMSIIEGYYHNGQFYYDTAHSQIITAASGYLYIDKITYVPYGYINSQFNIITYLQIGETTGTAFDGLKGKKLADDVKNAYTLNNLQANWNETDNQAYSYIQNKPAFGNVYTYNVGGMEIFNKPQAEQQSYVLTASAISAYMSQLDAKKQDNLVIVDSVTANNTNAVQSGAVYTAIKPLNEHITKTDIHITSAERTKWNGKQDALTWDSTPQQYSGNSVKSGGIWSAIANASPNHSSYGLILPIKRNASSIINITNKDVIVEPSSTNHNQVCYLPNNAKPGQMFIIRIVGNKGVTLYPNSGTKLSDNGIHTIDDYWFTSGLPTIVWWDGTVWQLSRWLRAE